MKRSNKKGFTIVELVIVIAIIAILAAVLIPTFASLIQKANESNDIQAAKNMNTFLAMANVTDGVDSILDVYDLFESSGYSVESYKPLYAGRSYYYDKQANQIVYVDDTTNEIIYPTERKGQLQGEHDWLSLSMTVAKMEKPATYDDTTTANKIKATVTTAAEYAYVVEKYNEMVKNTGGNTQVALELTLTADLDLKGAKCVIDSVKGQVKVTGSKSDGKPAVIKNVTSDKELETATTAHNNDNIKADLYAGGFIAECMDGSNVEISNVVFENVNVKAVSAGAVGIIFGRIQRANVTLSNVTVKNCSAIGHRDVGSLVGALQNCDGNDNKGLTLSGNVELNNVKVKTAGGRSGLVVGKVNGASKIMFAEGANLAINNSAMSIYENSALEQKFANGSEVPTDWVVKKIVPIAGQDKYVYSLKGTDATTGAKSYVAYGYKGDALVLVEATGEWEAITTVEDLKGKWAGN